MQAKRSDLEKLPRQGDIFFYKILKIWGGLGPLNVGCNQMSKIFPFLPILHTS